MGFGVNVLVQVGGTVALVGFGVDVDARVVVRCAVDEETNEACVGISGSGLFINTVIKATKTTELMINNGTTLKRAKKQARWIGCQLGYIESHLGQRLEAVVCLFRNVFSKIFA